MKAAFFSDIHGNLEALQAVIADMESQQVTQRFCLGDIVGYGASPRECLEVIRKLNCPILMGNHDDEAWQDTPLLYRPHVLAGLEFARKQLNSEEKKFLCDLPLKMEFESFIMVHSSLFQPEKWHYLNNALNIELNFQQQRHQVCLCGHTHVPRFYDKLLLTQMHLPGPEHLLVPEKKYLVNIGSVGQPRDGDPAACYVIYHEATRRIEFRRVSYDIAGAQKKIRDAGLPEMLAERLAKGS